MVSAVFEWRLEDAACREKVGVWLHQGRSAIGLKMSKWFD